MITVKSSLIFMTRAVLAGILLTGCQERKPDRGEIPYNERNAQKHVITVQNAAQLTAQYRRGKNELIKQLRSSDYLEKSFSIPDAEMFNRDAIALLLSQKGAKGMRIYVGQDTKGLIRFVLIAVDNKGNDITGYNAKVLEAGQRCPTLCSLTGPLK